MEKVSLVVPCYNEEAVVEVFYAAIQEKVVSKKQFDVEYIFVNDGSGDRTLDKLQHLAVQDACVHYISFSRNFGKEAAMYAGLKEATGDYVAVMDVDLQDPPEMLLEMYEILTTEDYDCVGSRRVTRKGEPVIRSFFARSFYKIMKKLSDVEIVDGARDFRLMKRYVADAILELNEYNRFSKGIFCWVGFKTKYLEYENIERAAGETKWNFWKLFKYSIEGMVAFTTAPLFWTSFIGFVCCGISLVLLLWYLINGVVGGGSDTGFYTIVCLILFLSGVLLMAIGIIGIYMSKIYLEVKNRPKYIVKEKR
jgi:glycosyltransferase involved in cell wall biosynthesis